MQKYCIACNSRYFYSDTDDDCTPFVCSDCYSMDTSKAMSKWARLRFRILNRDEFTCKYCGDSPLKNKNCVLHIDHVIPKSKLCSNSEKNLITSCSICNLGKLNFGLNVNSYSKVREYLENIETERRLSENGITRNIKKNENDKMENSETTTS